MSSCGSSAFALALERAREADVDVAALVALDVDAEREVEVAALDALQGGFVDDLLRVFVAARRRCRRRRRSTAASATTAANRKRMRIRLKGSGLLVEDGWAQIVKLDRLSLRRRLDRRRAVLGGQVDREREEEGAEEDQDDAGGDQPAGCGQVAEDADREADQHQRDVGAGAVGEQRGERQGEVEHRGGLSSPRMDDALRRPRSRTRWRRPATSPTSRRRWSPSSPSGSASRSWSRARPGSARPSWPRRSPAPPAAS